MKKKNNRLIVIGSTWEQIPLIKKAKEMGCYVLGTDIDDNAEGFEYVDEKIVVSPRDLHGLLKIAKKFKPDGVTADECDYSHFAAVYISERLGLNNDGLEAAQNTGNKYIMRSRALEGRIVQPRFFSCNTYRQVCDAADSIGWPVIIKPHDNRGAYGVNIASNLDELKFAFQEAVMHSHSRLTIVESCINGTHITVDGCFDQNGKHHNLAIASKKTIPGKKPIICEVVYPADISEDSKKNILEANQDVVKALKIKSGLTHSEYILDTQNRCFLVETANRGGGVWTSAIIVPILSGVNNSELLINNALNKNYKFRPKFWNGFVSLKFFIFKPGKIKKITGIDKVKKIKGVKGIKINIRDGEKIIKPTGGGERHGFIIIKAKNKADLEIIFKKANKAIRINYA